MSPLGCSRPLQRVIVDFAADQPFAQARAKLQEHYGFAIGESTIQRITFAHAQAMLEVVARALNFRKRPGLRKPIVVETDGGMVPIVEPSCERKDKRKGKTLSWREAKLSLAHAQGSRHAGLCGLDRGRGRRGRASAAFLRGSRRLRGELPSSRGGRRRARIVGQVEGEFGDQGRYLIDFYHVCEYLAAASEAIAPDPAARSAWMETQKEALKGGRLDAVLRALAGCCEPPEIDNEHAPVRTCQRYLSPRANHLNYRQALADGLPTDPGETRRALTATSPGQRLRARPRWRDVDMPNRDALGNPNSGDRKHDWKAPADPSFPPLPMTAGATKSTAPTA